jgi:uncharacterized RDD family membrane protein YckC
VRPALTIDFEPTHPVYSTEETPAPIETAPPPPSKGGFWRRAVAYLLDLLLVELIYGIFLFIGAKAVDLAEARDFDPIPYSETLAVMAFSLMLLWAALFLLYFTFFTYWGGQTPGKMLMRVRVVTKEYGDLTLLRAFGRTLCYFLSSAFFGLGYLLAAINHDKRALHDLLAGTYVIRT